jgi:hypothetical protein
MAWPSLSHPKILNRVIQSPESFFENLARLRKVKTQPCLAARPKILTGVCTDSRTVSLP